jgi:predicted permease
VNHTIYLFKQAWAEVKAKPLFTGAVVSTLGLTIGALLCVLTLGYLLLVKPLPYPDNEHLYTVEHNLIDHNAKVDGTAFTYPNLMYLYNTQDTFKEAALLYYDADILLSKPTTPRLTLSYLTPSWFSMLGAEMAIGRPFENTEKLNTDNPVAVLSYETWKNEFNLDKTILTQTLLLGDVSYQIIGVLSKDFVEPQIYGTGYKSQVFLPWDYNPVSPEQRVRWGNDDNSMYFMGKSTGHLKPQQINQQLTSLINDNWQTEMGGEQFFKDWSISIKIHTLESIILGSSENTVYLLIAAAIGLVLIACTNIANLFMSRTAERYRNLAIHAAVGASRKQLFIVLLSETFILMVLAALLALCVATFGFTLLQNYLSSHLPRVDELSLNVVTLSSAIITMVYLTVIFASLCGRMINYRMLNQTLQSSGKGTGIQVSKSIRQGLILCQIMIVTALVFINMVLFGESVNIISNELGYDAKGVSFVVLSLPNVDESEQEQLITQMADIRNKLESLPEIAKVSQSMAPLPFSTLAMPRGEERYTARAKGIDHNFFSLIKHPIIEGDNISEADFRNSRRVIVVNEVFAKQLAPNGSAVGLTFDEESTIIGVVKGIKVPGETTIPPQVFFPTSPARNMFLVKTANGEEVSREQVLNVLRQVSGRIQLFSIDTLDERKNSRLFSQYTTAMTSAVLAFFTFSLAGIGLYGILSYGTQMRRFELGTRMAIGAKRQALIKLIIQDNAKVIILGMVLSIGAMCLLYIPYRSDLAAYIDLRLITLFVLTIGAISTLAFFACYWPLRRYINRPAIDALRGAH